MKRRVSGREQFERLTEVDESREARGVRGARCVGCGTCGFAERRDERSGEVRDEGRGE